MAKQESRRNQKPGSVRVLRSEDLSGYGTLDARVDAMIENRNEVVIHNIECILQQRGIAQAHMCNVDLEGSPQPPQLAAYKKVGRDIPFRTVVRIGMAYGYTPEQMYGQLLDQTPAHGGAGEQPRPYSEHIKYVGTYHMAFFGTDAKLGGNKRTTARSLSNGVVSVYMNGTDGGRPVLRVAAFLNCTDDERDALTAAARRAESAGNGVRACYEAAAGRRSEGSWAPRMKCFYEGELRLTERIAGIELRQVRGGDIVHIELHNRAANSSEGRSYKGGLATMMSTSRGEEHMPCVQAAILSRRGFAGVAREELAQLLFLEPPEVELRDETRAIVAYMKALFPSDGADTPLSQMPDDDRTFMLESYIEKKLTEVIRRNVLGYYKISTEMDSAIYKAVCR